MRSDMIKKGVERTPNRAMLRAVGFGDGDFAKPIIGVLTETFEILLKSKYSVLPLNSPGIFTVKPVGSMCISAGKTLLPSESRDAVIFILYQLVR